MGESEDHKPENDKTRPPSREISNANLFSDDIVFSDTEKILFEEDLQENNRSKHQDLMDGNPEKRYTPHKKLNQGGMKAIWEVDDHRTARKVAMALIQDSKIASEEDIDSFLYEARLTANLQHPNIIPIYDIAIDENGNPYFTMKALKGKTLGEILKEMKAGNESVRRNFTRTRMLNIFLKVCNAIDYAHSKGVIHLDLKPSNVIVGDFGDVHVLDWGLSTLMTHLSEYEGEPVAWHSIDDVSLEDGQTLTRYLESSAKSRERRNVVGGTPGYMSPEQAHGVPRDIDFRTDVYMLGALLYEILTLECPIQGGTVKDVLQKTVRGNVPPPVKRSPELKIPPALSAIAMKAMSTAPDERYGSVSALIRDIQQYQDGFATSAENPTFITHAALLVKRHKMAVSLIAVSLAIIVAILARSFASIKQSERVALEAKDLATQRFEELQEKNEYIATTAKKVAPDYLSLAAREELNYAFDAAEEALLTGLAFDPMLAEGWLRKGRILMSRLQLDEAWTILTARHGFPVGVDNNALRLIDKYREHLPISDADLPELVGDFKTHGQSESLPRFFHFLNQAGFNPESRFPAIAEALKVLNPEIGELNFSWEANPDGGWNINISENPNLDDISPLCGLAITKLNADRIGGPDLRLLTGTGLKSLSIADTSLNRLPDLEQWTGLQTLNLSGTGIRELSGLIRYPRITTLDISNIEGLAVSEQLIWLRKLKLLTVAEAFRENPTIRSLSRRGVIIIYSEN
jgi:serine/threonine protein kinase